MACGVQQEDVIDGPRSGHYRADLIEEGYQGDRSRPACSELLDRPESRRKRQERYARCSAERSEAEMAIERRGGVILRIDEQATIRFLAEAFLYGAPGPRREAAPSYASGSK